MIRFQALVIVIALLVGATACGAKELSPEELTRLNALREELAAVVNDVAEAEQKDQALAGGLVKALVGARIEILKTNKALLEQRINAIESGAAVTIEVPGFSPDPEVAENLLTEIEVQKEQLEIAKSEADRYTGGLVRAMKLSAVATQEQTLAMLHQRYLAAKYGLPVPGAVPRDSTALPDLGPAPSTGEASGTNATLPAGIGPFGLQAGVPRAEIEAMIGGALQEVEGASFLYSAKQAPKPHIAFEAYAFLIGPSSGLCQIRAIGKDIASSSHGIQLKSAFSELAESLTSAYGQSKTLDRLLPGSIWNEPEDWMRGSQKKERLLQASWSSEYGSTLKNQIERIDLVARAKSSSTGYLLLQYSFENNSQCEAEIKQGEKDVL